MKKTIMTSLILGSMALTLGSIFSTPAFSACPLNKEKPACEKPAPVEGPIKVRPMSPEEREKYRAQKKAEFESRLNLTQKQKEQLEQIKTEERKKLEPYREKIKQEQEKIAELFQKQKEVRMQSMKKFENILTTEQKEELLKIQEEMKEEIQKKGTPLTTNPIEKPMPPKHHGPHMCPPDCECNCHNPKAKAPDKADCKCPCHER